MLDTNTAREIGHYWVKCHRCDTWEIAFWSGHYWYVAMDGEGYPEDSALAEIDERKIERLITFDTAKD